MDFCYFPVTFRADLCLSNKNRAAWTFCKTDHFVLHKRKRHTRLDSEDEYKIRVF